MPDESAGSAARALEIAAAELASHGIAIERVLTDNGWAYTHGRAYATVIAGLGACHKRSQPEATDLNVPLVLSCKLIGGGRWSHATAG